MWNKFMVEFMIGEEGGSMLKLRLIYLAVMAALYFAAPYIGYIPLAIFGFAFPAYFVIKNWNALKYSKKRPPPEKIAEQAEKRYENMYGKKEKGD